MDHLIFVKLACIPNFSFLGELEVTFPGWVGGWGGWLETDNRAISVQLDLTGTELGKSMQNLTYGDGRYLVPVAWKRFPYISSLP